MMRTFAGFCGFAAGVLLTLITVSAVFSFQAENTPNCPQEDSCSIDYRDGGWHITEVQP
jgi:hypothetical protein